MKVYKFILLFSFTSIWASDAFEEPSHGNGKSRKTNPEKHRHVVNSPKKEKFPVSPNTKKFTGKSSKEILASLGAIAPKRLDF